MRLFIAEKPSLGRAIADVLPKPHRKGDGYIECAILAEFTRRKRIHFAHVRNIKLMQDKDFYECAHPSEYGSLDMYKVMQALYDNGFDGYIRPDHGRFIWGETGRPGYGLFDRALGVTYLKGLWEALSKR